MFFGRMSLPPRESAVRGQKGHYVSETLDELRSAAQQVKKHSFISYKDICESRYLNNGKLGLLDGSLD